MITPESDKKLFLVDAYALIFRAYFAFIKNPRVNSQGLNTSAAFGFTNALLEVINKEKPSHIAVVFDPPGGSTSRKEEFNDYKANRDETPEDIISNIGPIKGILTALNIPIIEVDGFEADDVIGALSKKAEQSNFTTYMMTPDKDFGQLVTEKSKMFRPGRGGKPAEIWGPKEVCEKFDVENVLQVIDILGLQGDAADNIPGIPGIGPKTAAKLLKQFGSVEGIIENAHQLKGKQKENIENFAEQGMMSKSLATIITDIDVELNEKDLQISEPNKDELRKIFEELEFRTLGKRILGEEITVKKTPPKVGEQTDLFAQTTTESVEQTKNSLENSKANYRLIDSSEKRKELLELLLQQKEVCFDTETSGLDTLSANLVGIAFSHKKGEAFYVPTPPSDKKATQEIVQFFAPLFENENIIKIAHNAKYDIKILMNYNVKVNYPIYDTMIAHYLIRPESKQSMDFLAEKYLNYTPVSIEELIGKKGKNQRSMADLKPEAIVDYACEDADITLQLKKVVEKEVEEEHIRELFYNMEMPLVSVLAKMEREGIAIDTARLEEYSQELGEYLVQLEKEIIDLAGEAFNVDSPKQLGVVLFDKLEITAKAKKTKSGQYSTSEDVLQKYKDKHEIIPKILQYRQFKKLKSTYVDPLPTMASEVDGRIHTNFMQAVAATGRLSSNNPNLQNIPIRSESGREIRKSFIARGKEFKLLAADYSQIELRIIAALSGDENMIKAFKEGKDIHATTASKVFSVPLDEVTRDQRSQAKAVNFGIIYGQSAFGLSQNLGIRRTEAKAIIDSYFGQYPTIKAYMDKQIEFAREKGYVETIFKRRRYLADIHSSNAITRGFAERNAVNAPIQGSAADVIKLAMIEVDAAMQKAKVQSKMLLQVHDELVFDVHLDEIDKMKSLVKKAMEEAVEIAVPMQVEMEVGENWLEAH